MAITLASHVVVVACVVVVVSVSIQKTIHDLQYWIA